MKDRLKAMSKVNEETGCIEWTGALLSTGYGVVAKKEKGGKRQNKRAHRVAYEEYVGEIPEGLFVCHHCDNRKCINPEHLFTGTVQDNTDDRERKGRSPPRYGELNGLAKLSDDKVILIREFRRHGFTTVSIAKRFGVCHGTISAVCTGRTWSHVKNNP